MADLLNQMSRLCDGEASIAGGGNDDPNLDSKYDRMESLSESAIEVLYNELGISKL